jgi:hypothetical protein
LAREAVGLCTDALKAAAQQVTAQGRGDPSDGNLFLVKHLLILREQLTPFDINFSQLRRKLDFSTTRQALAKFWRGAPGASIFSLSRNNALLELARVGLPSVDEHMVDAKHDLEDALKRACTRFIAHTTTELVEPLTALLAKSQAFTGDDNDSSSSSGGGGSGGGNSNQLRAQAFASADRVRAALQDTVERCGGGQVKATNGDDGGGSSSSSGGGGNNDEEEVGSVLLCALDKMALFLDSPVTRGILFKPVQRKVAVAVADTRALLGLLLFDAPVATELHGLLTVIEQAVASADLEAAPSPTPPPPPPAEARARAQAAAAAEAAAAAAAAEAAEKKKQEAERQARAAAQKKREEDEKKARAAAAAAEAQALKERQAAEAKAKAAEVKSAEDKAAAEQAAAERETESAAAANLAAEQEKEAAARAAAETAAKAAEEERAAAEKAAADNAAKEKAAAADRAAEEEKARAAAAAAAALADREAKEAAASAAAAAAAPPPPPAPPAPVAPEEGADEVAVARERLTRFYTKHNPEKLSEVEGTLTKFKGRFDVLFKKLNQKYGTNE